MKYSLFAEEKDQATKDYFEKNRFSAGKEYFRKRAKEHEQAGDLPLMINAANLAHKFSVYRGDYLPTIQGAKDLEQHYAAILAKFPLLSKNLYQNLAEAYFYLGKYKHSEHFAIEGLKVPPEDNHYGQLAHAENLKTLGKSYWKRGFFYESIYLYIMALEILVNREEFGGNHYRVGKMLNLIGVALLEVEPQYYEMGIDLLEKSRTIYLNSHLTEDHLYVGSVVNDLGYGYLRCIVEGEDYQHIYQELTLDGLEQDYFGLALHIFEKIYGYHGRHRHIATVYKYLARLNKEKEKIRPHQRKTLEYLLKELEIRKSALNNVERHPTLARNYNRQGRVYYREGNYREAARFAQMAIIRLYPRFGKIRQIDSIPDFLTETPSSGTGSLSRPELIKALRNKAEAMLALFEEEKNLKWLNCSFETLRLAVQVIEQIWHSNRIEEAKLLLSKNSRGILELALKTIILLEKHRREDPTDQNEIFRIFSRSKSVLLLETIDNDDSSNVQSATKKLKSIKALTEELKGILSGTFSPTGFHWREVAGPGEKRVNFKKNYLSTLVELEQGMEQEPNPAIISYFMGEKHLFGILFYYEQGKISIQIKELSLKSYRRLPVFRKACENFFDLINKDILEDLRRAAFPGTKELIDSGGNHIRFRDEGYALHNVLIEPFDLVGKKVERLYIIPDEDLFFIPFEALITNRDLVADYHKIRYLLNDYTISYHSSIQILIRVSKNEKETTLPSRVLDFDADHDTNKNGNTNQAYRNRIINLLEKHGYTVDKLNPPSKISKARLLPQFTRYGILNITAHGVLNTGIILQGTAQNSPVLLREEDIDHYLNNGRFVPELVVLNSCYTGRGTIIKGEGVKTMNRAFLSAGAQNIIYSLIAQPRQYAYEVLFHFFYAALEKEVPFGEALRLAKIELARKEYSNPKHWAGLVLMGNQQRMMTKPPMS
jgi:CHAT domain-containing protein